MYRDLLRGPGVDIGYAPTSSFECGNLTRDDFRYGSRTRKFRTRSCSELGIFYARDSLSLAERTRIYGIFRGTRILICGRSPRARAHARLSRELAWLRGGSASRRSRLARLTTEPGRYRRLLRHRRLCPVCTLTFVFFFLARDLTT